MGTSQLGTQLTDDEIDKITAFLESLTGEQPKVAYPNPSAERRYHAAAATLTGPHFPTHQRWRTRE